MNPNSTLEYQLAAKFAMICFPRGPKYMLPARLRLVMFLLSANLVSHSRCWQSHFGKGSVRFSAYQLRLLMLCYTLDNPLDSHMSFKTSHCSCFGYAVG